MKEKHVRAEIYNLLRRLWYWPITQTDLNAPFPIAQVNKLLGQLLGMTKAYPHIQKVVFILKAVLDKATPRPPKGRPDILVLNPMGSTRVVEVKVLNLTQKKSFSFTEIDDSQRRWLDRWEEDGGLGFLALGTVGVARGQRRCWLIPWGIWKSTEASVSKYQLSIPYEAGPGFKKPLQEHHLDIITQFAAFELAWRLGCWHADNDYFTHSNVLWPGGRHQEREL